jgi:PEP-CTERM motif
MKWKLAVKHHALQVIVVLTVMALTTVVGHASDITYDVNRIVGAGSVMGFIETNGATGVLNAGDLVDWKLKLFNGTDTYTLTGPLSGNNSGATVQGVDLTATATQILFNFSGTDNGYFLVQTGPPVGNTYYCDATFSGICVNGETVTPTSYPTGSQISHPSGNVVIGTAVPEPGSLALLGSGFVAAVGALRRKFSR